MPVAVITGSSSGIGQAVAIRFARAGYAVVLHCRRNLSGLQRTAAEAAATGAQVLCITADVASRRACRDMVETAYQWQGEVDVWLNNAGADVLTGGLANASFDTRLQTLFDVDVGGSVRLGRLVAPRMASQGGHRALINLGWDQAELGMEGEAGQLFCTAKAAVTAFTRALALTFPQVHINCVAPGWIKTAWGDTGADEYWDQRARSESLAGRWGTPMDVAEAVFWLAQPSAAFVDGQTLTVNGGRRFYPTPRD